MSTTKRLVVHLLPNAHLDPVWLWDWREGLNEGITTTRTVLDLMDEFPELTFMRGESAIYSHIQKTAPNVFKRIQQKIDEGRWDVVGGTVIQPDSNLASTESLCREFERGLAYFEKNLNVRPTVAWQADSFGHTAGFPNILSSFGMEGFTFTRPQQKEFPLQSPAFWWEGDWGNRILCYRQHWKWYCSERDNMHELFETTLTEAAKLDYTHAGMLFGLGNHGGGPTRRHLREVQEWREKHPEVEIRFSTLHGFFAELKKEATARTEKEMPVVRGEFGYCLRGCYSSVQKFKSLYRQSEAQVAEAETTRSLIGAATETPTLSLDEAWDAIAFNAFHDILPGTSIERAVEDQTAWMGLALHRARQAKFAALNLLSAKVDTTVPAARRPDVATDVPVILWNPLPRPFSGLAELEAPLDYRPLWAFKDKPETMPVVVFDHAGNPTPFQIAKTEHNSMTDVPWRRRVVVPVELPAFGWTTLRIGYRDEPEAPAITPVCTAVTGAQPRIANGEWEVSVQGDAVQVLRGGKAFFLANRNLQIRLMKDLYGSWGGMQEEKDAYCIENLLENWTLAQSEVLEEGPLRAKLWTRWKGANSWVDLTFTVAAETPELAVEGRLLINERSARLKLVIPCAGDLVYDVPGSTAGRNADGQVPAARWVTRSQGGRTVGFSSDVLSDFDASESELRVTLARVSRYADDVVTAPGERVWQPAVDCGELKFRLAFFGEGVSPDHVTESLLFPPSAAVATPQSGLWAREGSLGAIEPACVRLLSLEEEVPGRLKVRIQNRSEKAEETLLRFGASCIALGKLGSQQIQTYVIAKHADNGWQLAAHGKTAFSAKAAPAQKPELARA